MQDEHTAKKEQESAQDKLARRTANATVWIAIFTVALAGAAILTLWEVIKGGSDTHDLAVSAGKQADAMRDLVTAVGKQADASKALADLTAKQFTASQQLVESQRALIEVSFAAVNNPVTFHDGSVSIVFSIALRNIGGLAANKVKIRFQAYYSQWGESLFSKPMRQQRDFCNKPNELRLRADLKDLKGLTNDEALTIIPREVKISQINFGMGKPTDSEIIDWPPNQPNQTKRIFPIVVGCVDYQSGVMSKPHQTGFIFEVNRGDPKMPTPTFITYGEDVRREDVVVTQYFFGQGKSY